MVVVVVVVVVVVIIMVVVVVVVAWVRVESWPAAAADRQRLELKDVLYLTTTRGD